jgi:hypothetical protein
MLHTILVITAFTSLSWAIQAEIAKDPKRWAYPDVTFGTGDTSYTPITSDIPSLISDIPWSYTYTYMIYTTNKCPLIYLPDLQTEHERWLAEVAFAGQPVFVHNYPRDIKVMIV